MKFDFIYFIIPYFYPVIRIIRDYQRSAIFKILPWALEKVWNKNRKRYIPGSSALFLST